LADYDLATAIVVRHLHDLDLVRLALLLQDRRLGADFGSRGRFHAQQGRHGADAGRHGCLHRCAAKA
jgi:hypothetical protein